MDSWSQLGKFRSNNINVEETVLDVMDLLVGWCVPEFKLSSRETDEPSLLSCNWIVSSYGPGAWLCMPSWSTWFRSRGPPLDVVSYLANAVSPLRPIDFLRVFQGDLVLQQRSEILVATMPRMSPIPHHSRRPLFISDDHSDARFVPKWGYGIDEKSLPPAREPSMTANMPQSWPSEASSRAAAPSNITGLCCSTRGISFVNAREVPEYFDPASASF